MRRRLRVNPIACDGHGLCAELLPELVRLDEWGYPIVSSQPVPQRLEKHARRAVDACPTLALLLERAAETDDPAPSPQGLGKAPDRGGRGRRDRAGGSLHPQDTRRR